MDKVKRVKGVDRPQIGGGVFLTTLVFAYTFGVKEACEEFMQGEKHEYAVWLMYICCGNIWMVLEDEGLVPKGDGDEGR